MLNDLGQAAGKLPRKNQEKVNFLREKGNRFPYCSPLWNHALDCPLTQLFLLFTLARMEGQVFEKKQVLENNYIVLYCLSFAKESQATALPAWSEVQM